MLLPVQPRQACLACGANSPIAVRVTCGMAPFVVLALAALLGLGAVIARRSRSRALEETRALWSRPVTRERKMEAIAASHRSRLANIGSGASLDDRTWDDLNLDAVFAAVDRTESTLGQHALYHRLRSAPDAENLEVFEVLVSRFETDARLRERTQAALSRLTDPHGYDLWWLARRDAIEAHSWHALFPVLTAATILLLVLTVVSPQFTPALLGILAFNIGVRYVTDRRIGMLAAAFRQIAPLVRTAEALRLLGGDDVRPLVAPIQEDTLSLRRLKTISRWISGNPLMLPFRAAPLAVMVSDVVSVIYEYLNLALLLDANGVYFGARDLRVRHAALLRVIAAIGEVDAAISTASYRTGRQDWTRPRFREPGAPAELTGVRHPLLLDAVPNSIRLTPGRGVLITGSNMSGKSTFLRTLGVTAVMAQTLNTCLAAEYSAPVFNVRSCIGRSDDLLSGKSYYIAEVESLLGLVEASADSAPHLFLLDELFRGTNAVERIAAGQAVLLEMVSGANGRTNPHAVIAATHDGELVDLLPDSYSAFHFGDAIGPDGLTFDHQLRPGPATTRNAIALLRINGASEDLVRRALECAAMLDAQRGTALQGR
jgi:hypothetical protein